MELRKAEAEVDELRAEYERLRVVAVAVDADQHQQPDLSSVLGLSPLLDLLAQVQQDRPASLVPSGNGACEGDMTATSTADADADFDAGGVPLKRTISAAEALEAFWNRSSHFSVRWTSSVPSFANVLVRQIQ